MYVTSYSQYILKHTILLQAGKFNIFGQGEGEVYVLINIASFLCNACNEKKNTFVPSMQFCKPLNIYE